MKNPARYMLPGILVNFFDRCPYLMGNRFMHWQGNIAINILLLLLLLLLDFPFQIEAPPTIIASEDQELLRLLLLYIILVIWARFPFIWGEKINYHFRFQLKL